MVLFASPVSIFSRSFAFRDYASTCFAFIKKLFICVKSCGWCKNMDNPVVLHMKPANIALVLLFVCACFPVMAAFFYSCYRLVFGTLYPAYASYKAVKTKNVKEYVKWMMYWIVFALFTCVETFADILVSFWLPFYYETKILFVLWLLSPATKGSSILYRRFVHPQLTKREKEIDDYIAKASEQGYSAMLQLGSKGLSYATAVVMQTALKGQETLVQHLRKSYSMSDLAEDGSSSSQQYSTAISHTSGVVDETDSGSDDHHLPLVHRWMSEDVLVEDEKMIVQSKGQSVSSLHSVGTTRRTLSVKASRGGAKKTKGLTKQSSYEEVSGYATLPRTTRPKTKKKAL